MRVGSPRIDQKSPTTSDVPVYQVILNKRYRPHRYWSWVGRAHDIALLKLTWPLKYNKYVWPICLPGLDFEVKDGSLCTVTGWGLPKFDGESVPPEPVGGVVVCVGEPGGVGGRPGSLWTAVSETSSLQALVSFPLGRSWQRMCHDHSGLKGPRGP